ncbi:hypothetical protein FDZ71_06880, partial [bacterium]
MAKNLPSLGEKTKVLETTFGAPPGKIAANVILTPFVPLRAFSRHADEGTLLELSPPFFFQGLTAMFGGVEISVIRTGIGPSRVGDAISFLSLSE